MSAGGIFLFLIKAVGIIALVLLFVLLLVLFVPIRYRLAFSNEDPEGTDTFDGLNAIKNLKAKAAVTWLFPFLSVRAAVPGDGKVDLRILWLHYDLLDLFSDKDGEEEKDGRNEEKKDRRRALMRRIRKVWKTIQSPSFAPAVRTCIGSAGHLIAVLLPKKWSLKGTVGLGDPAASGRVMELYGMMYPWVYGHVLISPEWMLYRFDLQGSAQGKVTVFSLVRIFLRLYMDKDVRRMMHRFRK